MALPEDQVQLPLHHATFQTLAVTGLSIATVVTAYGSGYDSEDLYARDLDLEQNNLYVRDAEPYGDLYERDIDDRPYYAGYKRDIWDGKAMQNYRRALIDEYLSSLSRRDIVVRTDKDEYSADALKASMRKRPTSYNDAKNREEAAKKARKTTDNKNTGGNPSEKHFAENKIAHKHFHS
ncbi:hypothetical protein MMC26_006039 [Xylographa opegraphella]|nr:hypothetical protein [Xylographa opegraphella]